MWFLQLPAAKLSTPFLNNGVGTLTHLSKPTSSSITQTHTNSPSLTIKSMKTLEGKVVCSTNDKTVAVEVTRLAPHPKYKKRIRMKKKYQAHDPDNQFQVGDIVQLCKTRPISKNKTFLAIPAVKRQLNNASGDLDIPLESQQEQEQPVSQS